MNTSLEWLQAATTRRRRSMGSLALLVVVVLFIFQQWFDCRTRLSLREGSRVRRALFRGEAFAHNYRMWQRVYREIRMNGELKNVDN